MPHKNPEARKAYQKAYQKARYEKNKEELKAYFKARYENKKEEVQEYFKNWRQTPAGKKSHTISNWKIEGLIDSDEDNYEKLYNSYIASTHCDICKTEYTSSFDRCMDRDHDTNLFRQFLCQDCNRFDRWKKFQA